VQLAGSRVLGDEGGRLGSHEPFEMGAIEMGAVDRRHMADCIGFAEPRATRH
jgi:hypothetical protein